MKTYSLHLKTRLFQHTKERSRNENKSNYERRKGVDEERPEKIQLLGNTQRGVTRTTGYSNTEI